MDLAPAFAKYLEHETLCPVATTLLYQISAVNTEAVIPYIKQLNTILHSAAWGAGLIAHIFGRIALATKSPQDKEVVLYLINFLDKIPFRPSVPTALNAIHDVCGSKPDLVKPHVEILKRFVNDKDPNASMLAQKALAILGITVEEKKSKMKVHLVEKNVNLQISSYEDLVKQIVQIFGNANISLTYNDDGDDISIKSQDDLDVAAEMLDDEDVLKINVKLLSK